MTKATSRKVWGTTETTECEEDRMTSTGTDLDRSRYASSSDEEPSALRHSRGKESNVVRHCWQTAVALIRSRKKGGGKNEGFRGSLVGGSEAVPGVSRLPQYR